MIGDLNGFYRAGNPINVSLNLSVNISSEQMRQRK
jgi:hypothetical protein